MNAPVVTVSLITYNHARFIEQAVESVLMQETHFPYELVIGEDESNDATREIVQRYAAAHPDLIRLHLHSRASNLSIRGKPTGRQNFVHNIRSARGKYIALLDGDDFWTSPHKLQRQVDYLEKNAGCAICFHRADVVDEEGQRIEAIGPAQVTQPTYSLADYLQHRFFPRTCTVMFRRGLFPDFPPWYFTCPVGDFPLHVLNAHHGDFGFIDEAMGAYRIHAGGLWSLGIEPGSWWAESREQRLRLAARLEAMIGLYETIFPHVEPKYRSVMRRQIAEFAQWEAGIHRSLEDRPAMRKSLWKAFRAQPSLPGRLAIGRKIWRSRA
jgi:glycosyltransferase involved in cell wall biosynthesis